MIFRVSDLVRFALLAILAFGSAASVRAEHARIDLRVIGSGGKEASATSDTDPPAGGRNTPPVLKVKANQPLVLQFFFTNTDPHHDIDQVQIRYYIVRVEKLGRKPAATFPESAGRAKDSQPFVEPGVVSRGQFNLDFKPETKVGTRLKFQIPAPGIYSVRVGSVGTQSDHEHFSAIDLVAE
ncbi:MAG TPA: hypothetical protein VFG04_07470 [Planctomycetaceae bacterium]|jgi:hypothetical protein|nr:hypothetical protein [Planctomycetaceae bacterium]